MTEIHLGAGDLCVTLMPLHVQPMPLRVCARFSRSFCLSPALLGGLRENSPQDPLCWKSWAQGLWVLGQIATVSCPRSCPTAGAPSLIAKSNRHSFCVAPALSRLAGAPAGVGPSALCPPACRPSTRPPFPAGECHHAACSEHSCLAKASSRCGAQRPNCAWQWHPQSHWPPGQLEVPVLNKKRVKQQLLGKTQFALKIWGNRSYSTTPWK